jgi:hypothetical protein
LIFAGILTLAIGLLFATHGMEVKLGAINSAEFTSRSDVALLLGILCGLSEKALSSQLASQATAFVSGKRLPQAPHH